MPPATRKPITDAGLPAAAKARLARFDSSTARTSLLGVPSAFGLATVGLEPVGDVMGAIGSQQTTMYLGRCGLQWRAGGPYGTPPSRIVRATATRGAWSYPRRIRSLYTTALARLSAEARAVGADGVVGVRLDFAAHDTLREVVAVGTAVRADSRVRPARPFVTHLGGSEVARLMLAGWVPVDLVIAVETMLRHTDTPTLQLLNVVNRGYNAELESVSELAAAASDAAEASVRAQTAGADGFLLDRRATTHWTTRCVSTMEGEDLVAQCFLSGTTVARFHRRAAHVPEPLRIMPLKQTSRKGPR